MSIQAILCPPVCQCLSIQHLPSPRGVVRRAGLSAGRPVCGQAESRISLAVRLRRATGGPTGPRRPAQHPLDDCRKLCPCLSPVCLSARHGLSSQSVRLYHRSNTAGPARQSVPADSDSCCQSRNPSQSSCNRRLRHAQGTTSN
jgi:hypothetical protein